MADQLRVDEQWRLLFEEGKAIPARKRISQLYAMMPAGSRCRVCNMPLNGLGGEVMHILGRSQSNINPHLCSTCDSFFRTNPGGVEIRLSMIFADIRGSTGLAEKMAPADFKKLIDRFYAAATEVLSRTDAVIDKLAGDQVSGYFVPGLAGPDYARVALRAAEELLHATGYGSRDGPWITVGAGVHTGTAFIGSVGSRGGIVDVTALGDAVNVAARLASLAGAGEILASEETLASAGSPTAGLERRELPLKGRSQPVSVYVLFANGSSGS